MGLLDRFRTMRDPVDGVYRLVSCSYGTGGASFENCTMDGVVTAPGVPPTAVHHLSLLTPTAKWPNPGQELPVTLEAGNPHRLRIRWDRVPSAAQTARLRSEQEAAAMRSGAAADPAPASSVLGAPGRPSPGAPGGGLSPEESAQVALGRAAALGLQAMTGTVVAAHRVEVPAFMPQAPGGTWDLTIDVAPPNGPGYSTVLRIGFSSPARQTEVGRIGRVLPVVADPMRPDRIAVDTSRLQKPLPVTATGTTRPGPPHGPRRRGPCGSDHRSPHRTPRGRARIAGTRPTRAAWPASARPCQRVRVSAAVSARPCQRGRVSASARGGSRRSRGSR